MTNQEPIEETTEKLFTRTKSRRYRDWVRIGSFLLIISVFFWLFLTHRLDRFENIVLDSYLRYFPFKQVHPAVALIEISDASLEEIGTWPWPRRYHAVTAKLLSDWDAAAIVFDFNFPNETIPKDDLDLAQVLEKIHTSFYLPVDLRPQQDKKFWLHGRPIVLSQNEGKLSWVHSLREFEANAKGIGHHHLIPDADGILRRFEPFIHDGQETYPFLALPVAFDFLKNPIPQDWGAFKDPNGKILIPWAFRRHEGFAHYNYADLIQSYYAIQKGMKPVISPEQIAGKICLIGLTSEEQTEIKATPFDISYPSLGALAHVVNSILTGQWIRPASSLTNLLCLLGIGILAAFLFFVLRSATSLLAGLLIGLGWFMLCAIVFAKMHLWIYSIYPLGLVLSLFIFSAIYAQLVTSREKTHLFHLATRDGLTDLYVIRHFRLIMNQIVRESSAKKELLSVILMDIDNFKKINDTYGHPAGDMVLKKTASLINAYIRTHRPFREIDFAARYGGEEFIVMLRRASLKQAVVVAERIRERVERSRFEWESTVIPVTISLGVAILHLGENVPDPMVHRADAALYNAKRSGKNKVCPEED